MRVRIGGEKKLYCYCTKSLRCVELSDIVRHHVRAEGQALGLLNHLLVTRRE